MKKFIPHLIPLILFISNIANGQTNSYQNWILEQRLPGWALNTFKDLGLESEYKISDFINPFYLEADFNGDNKLDIAITVEQKETKKKGIIVLHGSTESYFIFGAGNSFGNGGDDFYWMDIWKVHRDIDATKLTFDENSEINGSQDFRLISAGLDVQKRESAGGLIYWDGQQYKWAQTSD